MPPRNGLSPSSDGTVIAKVLTLSAITGDRFDETQFKESTFHSKPSSNQTVDHRDFLICRGNGNIQLVGRGFFPTHNMEDTLFPDTMIAVRPNAEILPEFLEFLWNGDVVRRQIEAMARTTNGTFKINQKMFERIEIPLPSIPEQQLIARALGQAAALRDQRRKAIALIDDLAKSTFLDLFGDPVKNAQGFESVPLTEACHPYSGGTPTKSNAKYWSGNLPWFTPKDMKHSDLWDSQDHISEQVPQETNLKLLPPNTVAIVVRGMILSHTFPVSVLRIPATINQDIKALLPKREIEPQFLAACLRAQSTHALQQVSTAAHGTKRLDGEGLGNISIILPSMDLQRHFTQKLDKINQIRASHQKYLNEADALFTSLQQRAFRGDMWDNQDN